MIINPTLKRVTWEQALLWLLLLSVAALPFEMVISVARNQVVRLIGPTGYFFHPAVGVVVALIFLRRLERPGLVPALALASLAAYAGGLTLSGVLTGSESFYVVSTVLLGPAFMAIVILGLQGKELRDRVIIAWLVGVAIWGFVFAATFVYAAKQMYVDIPWLSNEPIDSQLLALRFPGLEYVMQRKSPFFFHLFGNYNKQANLLIASGILLSWAFTTRLLSRATTAAIALPIAAMLLLCFSRGAFIACALTALAMVGAELIRAYNSTPLSGRTFISAGVFCAVVALSFSGPAMRAHWFTFQSVAERMTIVQSAGSAQFSNFDQSGYVNQTPISPSKSDTGLVPEMQTEDPTLCGRAPPTRDWAFYLFGYGLGNFGPVICRGPGAETHLAYQDAWVQGGVLGAIGFGSLFLVQLAVGGWQAARSKFQSNAALYGTFTLGATAFLALREYAFVYLWVQSAGGFVVALGISLICSSIEPIRSAGRCS